MREKTPTPSPRLEPLLSVADVIELLGISEAGLYRLLARGAIPSVKIGERRKFEPAAIRAYIESNRRPAAGT